MPEEIKAAKAEADLAKAKEEIEALGMQKYASTVTDEAAEFKKTIASILTKYNVNGEVKVENGMLVTELAKKPDTTKTVKAMNEFKKLTAEEEKEEKDKKAAAAENLLKRVARELEGKTVRLGQAYGETAAKAVITANINKLAYAKDEGVKVNSVTEVAGSTMDEYTVVISHGDTTKTESFVVVIK